MLSQSRYDRLQLSWPTCEAMVEESCQKAVHRHVGVRRHQDARRRGAPVVAVCQLKGKVLQHGHQQGALARAERAVDDADGGAGFRLQCIGMGFV